MSHEADFVQRWKKLPREQFEQELRQALKDGLPALVAEVERIFADDGAALQNCVVDDFRVTGADLTADGCRAALRFSGSARHAARDGGALETLAGTTAAVIDRTGRIAFRDVALAHAEAFVAPDVGGGD
jgi:hypothetical protein